MGENLVHMCMVLIFAFCGKVFLVYSVNIEHILQPEYLDFILRPC